MTRGGSIYIMTNKLKTTLYIGVTADLYTRIQEHKQHIYKNSFTDKYNLEYCVYYENYPSFSKPLTGKRKLKNGEEKKR